MENLSKRLLWSTFAMSLMLSPPSLGVDKTLDDLLINDDEALLDLKDETSESSEKEVPSEAPKKVLAPRPVSAEVNLKIETSVEGFLGVDEKNVEKGQLSDRSDKKNDSEEFLGLENEILPDLTGPQRFTPPNMHDLAELNVAPEAVEIDKEPLKGQKYSLINWPSIDPEQWLSIDRWLAMREIKDKIPDWKQRLREESHQELVGKVLQCRGTCRVFRGETSASVTHLSQIREGDEIHTMEDSQAWIYLMDGTLVRIGPKSSLSFNEIDWSKDETFLLLRLNKGHVHISPRNPKNESPDTSPETDAISLPLLVREANLEYFERLSFKNKNDQGRMGDILSLEENAVKSQVNEINRLRVSNMESSPDRGRVMLVTPGITLISRKTEFDVVYMFGGDTYFKKGTGHEGSEFKIQKRGYRNVEIVPFDSSQWHKSAELGRSVETVADEGPVLQVLELLTRRIRTIDLAREIWFEKFTRPVLSALGNPKKIAVEHGYVLWGEELSKRVDYLTEYTRRLETTNLRSIENLLSKTEGRNGAPEAQTMNEELFRRALNHYLMGLKNRNVDKKMQTREMNDLQYYVWILKKGKL